jgi:SSS family solute:Na+ symporter
MRATLGSDVFILGAVVIYVIGTTALTLVFRSRSNEQYMVAGRALPAGVIGILLMSEFIGAKSTVGTSQAAFEHGMAAAWSVLGASIGFVLLALGFAQKIRSSTHDTISGLVEQQYGTGVRKTISAVMIYALLLVNVGNYVGGAAILAPVLHIGITPSLFLVVAFSSAYHVVGGMKGIAYVTLLHTLVKLVALGILVAVAVSLSGGLAPITRALPVSYFTWQGTIGWSRIVAWVVATVGTIFSTQFIVQALASTRSAAAARASALIAAALCLPLGIGLALVGVAARYVFPAEKSLYALPAFISKMSLPLAATVTVSLVASVLVSVSTVALAITALVIRDFYAPWKRPTPAQELRATRVVAAIVGLVPLLCVFYIPHILALSFFTRALRLSIAVVALIGVYLPWIGSTETALVALILSALSTTGWYLAGNPLGIDSIYIAGATPAVVFLGDALRKSHRKPEITGADQK